MSSNTCAGAHVLRGAMAGMIGGLVGSWVMTQFQAATQRSAANKQSQGDEESQSSSGNAERQQQSEGDDATVKTAQAISRGFFSHELSPGEKKIAGPAVHYGYGALVGGIYGALAEMVPGVAAGFGIPYGMALFALGDEAAVPALGLGPPPTQIPAKSHADYLAAHIVYGVALDATRRFARHVV